MHKLAVTVFDVSTPDNTSIESVMDMLFTSVLDDLNGAILSSSTTSSSFFTIIQSAIITNQPVGNRTYVFTIQLNIPTAGDFYRFHSDATSLAYIVDFEDTHTTHETEVIP